MSSSPDIFEEHDDSRTPERPPALTPLLESARGDGYRWASIDVFDLDPPTPLLPYVYTAD